MKTKRKKKSSSFPKDKKDSNGSDNYIFSNEKNRSYSIKHVSNYAEFMDNFRKLENPSYTTDSNYIDKIGFLKAMNEQKNFNNEIKYKFSIEEIDKTKIFPIEDPKEFFQVHQKLSCANFIFSNLFENEEEKENDFFDTMHDYSNGYFNNCKLSDFCIDYKLHFSKTNINRFYKINKNDYFVDRIKVFHSYNNGIGHFYSPKYTGKSILFRSINQNFADFDDMKRLTPFIFFNMPLLFNLINKGDIQTLRKIILHESYNLFMTKEQADDFMKKINFQEMNLMKLIENIINLSIEINAKYIVIFLDGYSFEYDEENILNNLKKKVIETKKLFLNIIYDCLSIKDSEMFFVNINPKNHINCYSNELNKYFYFEDLKKLSEIKDELNNEQNLKKVQIPNNYNEYFGENVGYLFEFIKAENGQFQDFVKEKKIEIKNELENYYKSKTQFYLNKIYEIIEKKETFNYDEILKYIPFNYIKVIIEPKPQDNQYYISKDRFPKKYSLVYSFPLIKEIIEELISNLTFIDMKSKEFLELPPALLGNEFDWRILKIMQNMISDKTQPFFEHTKKTWIFVDDILEKEKEQTYKKVDVIKKMNDQKFQKLKDDCIKIDFSLFTLIGIFQRNPSGKAFDALFLVKEESKTDYIMNLVQIKCSDTYKEEKDNLIFQVEYVKHKFEYLLQISINSTYLSYLSIFEKPKLFAESNKSRTFLYNLNTKKFVDFSNNEYKKFPILKASIIYGVGESKIINKIIDDLIEHHNKIVFLIKKDSDLTKFKDKKMDEIKKVLNTSEIYVFVSSNEFRYYYKSFDGFYTFEKYIKNNYRENYEHLFEVDF